MKGVKSIFAAALCRIDDTTIDAFISEIKIMTPLRHPNIIYFYGGMWTQGADRVCLVLEFAGRGSLDEWIGKDEVAWPSQGTTGSSARGQMIAVDTARGLTYLHARSPPLVHRDVKPHNVMLVASFVAKLADFGEAKENKTRSSKGLATIVGSPMYIAPEVVRAERYAEPADVFSFALVLLELVSGVSTEDRFKQMDIDRKGIAAFHQTGKRADLEFVEKTKENGAALKLVERCWSDDPEKRPRMAECGVALAAASSDFDAAFSSMRRAADERKDIDESAAALEEKSYFEDPLELKLENDELKSALKIKDAALAEKDEELRKRDEQIAGLRRRLRSREES